MSGYKIIYILLSLVSVVCIIQGYRLKRKNIGFLVTAFIIAVSDLICVALENAQGANEARNILMTYFLFHAWLPFAFLTMIICIESFRFCRTGLILSGLVSLYQTFLIAGQFLGARFFSFQKRIYFRRAWWVVTDSKNTGLLFSYRSYRIMMYINMAIIISVLIGCIIFSHRIFRSRFVWLIVTVVAYSVAEAVVIRYTLPVWIPCAAYTLISLSGLYLTGYYATNKLTEWSLDSFANDMSDGLILYDDHDDLIHMNDMIRNTLHSSLIDEFRERRRLDQWIADSMARDSGGNGILSYDGADHTYYFKVNVRELGGHDHHLGTFYMLHDTTDSIVRIRTVEKANRELERVNRMKSDFLANMSHEIRTPMNAVIGMAELAMRENESPQIMDYLHQIQSSGRNLLNIINDILDYSKIESGKMEIVEEEYEPFTELSDIANMLTTRIGDKNLELFCLIESELPHILKSDAMRIRQILINLANNAIKFTNEGMVRIRVRCDRLSQDKVNVVYHVEDTGVGIKEEDLSKLFVSFQQVDSRRNRSVEGTGLGLAISQRLVAAMHGEIGVISEYGKGSDFWFSIPQKVVDDLNEIRVDDAASRHAFVLNDDPGMVEQFVREMERLGVEGSVIRSFDEYIPSGKKDYIFFEEKIYEEAAAFIKERPDTVGIVLVGFASELDVDVANIHIMRKPETTMSMVRILNDRFEEVRDLDDRKIYVPDFTAPDADILVVDDNDINLTITEGLLAPLKVKIDRAGGGEEAVLKASEKEYDIIFMDHMMPGMDGVDAAREIRAAGSDPMKPVIIALSANVMEEAKRLFRESGMNDFVAKPVNVRDIITKIKQWLPEEKIQEKTESDTEDRESDTIIRCGGIDTDIAVKALGSAALYDRIAEEYYRSGRSKAEDISTAYANEDWENYTIRVHALKSSSRQIGAMKLGDMAERLEKAGKAQDLDTIRSETGEMLEVFNRLLDGLSEYFAEEEIQTDKPGITADELNKLLDELDSACEDLDMDAMEKVAEELKRYSYNDDTGRLVNELCRAVSDIDTDACTGIAEDIRRSI